MKDSERKKDPSIEHKTETGKYTEAFSEDQENQFKPENAMNYRWVMDENPKKPVMMGIYYAVFGVISAIICGVFIMNYKQNDVPIFGVIVCTIMLGGFSMLLFMAAFRMFRKKKRRS
jgi:hypothetical protein